MDGLEQAIEKLEALGFTYDLARVKAKIPPRHIHEFTKYCNEYKPERYTLCAYFDAKIGQYKVKLNGDSRGLIRQIFETRLIQTARHKFPKCIPTSLELDTVINSIKRRKKIPEDMDIGYLSNLIGGANNYYIYFPKLEIEGTNLEEIFETFTQTLAKLGYK